MQTLEQEFVQFWSAHPKKRNREDAMKAFTQARRKGVTLDKMLTALAWQRLRPDWMKDNGQFVPYPATWIRAGGYDDEPDEQPVPKEYWAEECQRVHGGTCRKNWEHSTKMLEGKAS